jgi:hypothetical protein
VGFRENPAGRPIASAPEKEKPFGRAYAALVKKL